MKRAAALVVLLLPTLGHADGDAFGITGKVGTLGFGFEVSRSFLGSAEARLAFNQFSYSYDGVASDVDYTLDLGLRSTSLMLGWHPGRSSVRLGGGLLLNGTNIEAVGKPAQTYTIGGTTYDAGDVGTLDARLEFARVVPMAGLGWDGAFAGNRLGVALDLGVVFQGSPDIVMQASGPVALDADFMADLEQETADMQDALNEYELYPVASVGLSFRF